MVRKWALSLLVCLEFPSDILAGTAEAALLI